MKIILTVALISLYLLPLTLLGQNGYFDNNPIWTCQSGWSIAYPCIEWQNYNYYVNGDSIIGSHSYKKLFKKGIGYYSYIGPNPVPGSCQSTYFFNDSINPCAFVREAGSKIFMLSQATNFIDSILYDFNLSVGDSIPRTFNNNDSTITVVAIDSIPVSNFYRKRFQLSNNSTLAQYLIEGIGHDHGFIEPMGIYLDWVWNLLCYGLGDTAYYPTLAPTCNINVGIEEQTPYDEIKISPNPFTDNLTITLNKNQPLEITLYDITSSKVLNQRITNSTSLNTSHLAKGIYIYEVRDDKGIIKKGKVVKE